MKKLLLLIIFIGSIFHVYAKGDDTPQVQFAAITTDSLSLRLEKLQHDYDYMDCDYKVNMLIMDLKDLAHSIEASSNRILIYIYNSRYNNDLYNVYLEDYKASCSLFESLKEKTETVRTLVSLKMMFSGFTDNEIAVLTASLDVINKTTIKVQSSLDYYDVVIKAYRDKK